MKLNHKLLPIALWAIVMAEYSGVAIQDTWAAKATAQEARRAAGNGKNFNWCFAPISITF